MLNNVATFMWYPLVAGLVLPKWSTVTHIFGVDTIAYYLVVFATFVLALAVNFFGMFGFRCYLDGSSIVRALRGLR